MAPLLTTLVSRSLPYRISFARPELAWSRAANRLELAVANFEVRTQEGAFVASAPEASIALDAAALVLEAEVRPVAIVTRLPEIELRRHPHGGFSFSFGGKAAVLPAEQVAQPADPSGRPGALLTLLGGGPEAADPRLAQLREVTVTAPSLEIVDEASGRSLVAGATSFTLAGADRDWWARLAATFPGRGRPAR